MYILAGVDISWSRFQIFDTSDRSLEVATRDEVLHYLDLNIDIVGLSKKVLDTEVIPRVVIRTVVGKSVLCFDGVCVFYENTANKIKKMDERIKKLGNAVVVDGSKLDVDISVIAQFLKYLFGENLKHIDINRDMSIYKYYVMNVNKSMDAIFIEKHGGRKQVEYGLEFVLHDYYYRNLKFEGVNVRDLDVVRWSTVDLNYNPINKYNGILERLSSSVDTGHSFEFTLDDYSRVFRELPDDANLAYGVPIFNGITRFDEDVVSSMQGVASRAESITDKDDNQFTRAALCTPISLFHVSGNTYDLHTKEYGAIRLSLYDLLLLSGMYNKMRMKKYKSIIEEISEEGRKRAAKFKLTLGDTAAAEVEGLLDFVPKVYLGYGSSVSPKYRPELGKYFGGTYGYYYPKHRRWGIKIENDTRMTTNGFFTICLASTSYGFVFDTYVQKAMQKLEKRAMFKSNGGKNTDDFVDKMITLKGYYTSDYYIPVSLECVDEREDGAYQLILTVLVQDRSANKKGEIIPSNVLIRLPAMLCDLHYTLHDGMITLHLLAQDITMKQEVFFGQTTWTVDTKFGRGSDIMNWLSKNLP